MENNKKRKSFIQNVEQERLNNMLESIKEGTNFEDPLATLVYERDYYKREYEIMSGLLGAKDYIKELKDSKKL